MCVCACVCVCGYQKLMQRTYFRELSMWLALCVVMTLEDVWFGGQVMLTVSVLPKPNQLRPQSPQTSTFWILPGVWVQAVEVR